MFSGSKPDVAIARQAAEWCVLLDSGEMNDLQRADFHSWLAEPRHERELRTQRALLALAQDLPHRFKTDIEKSLSGSRAVLALSGRRLTYPLWFSAVAAALTVAAFLVGWRNLRPVVEYFTHTYSSEIGETRTVRLPQGIVAYLNTQSRLKWVGSRTDRRAVLERGEVLFEVEHDSTRPFRITVGHSEIRDVGTRFDVYRKSDGSVVVTVLEGAVAVKDNDPRSGLARWTERELTANQQIEYGAVGVIADVHPTLAPKAVAWRDGLLTTQGEPLSNVVNELSRYTTKKIIISDARLNANRIGGNFSVRDVAASLARIEQIWPVVVTELDDAFILSYRAEAAVPLPRQPLQGGRHP